MEFAASILTAIDLGFKTSKFIHSVLAGIKDGPDSVQHAATAVYGLLSTLEQLAKCRALDESSSQGLKVRLLKCVDDLEYFDDKLRGLTIKDSEKRCGQYWKRIKALYNEKALDKIGSVIAGHTAALNLELSVLQRYVGSGPFISSLEGDLHHKLFSLTGILA